MSFSRDICICLALCIAGFGLAASTVAESVFDQVVGYDPPPGYSYAKLGKKLGPEEIRGTGVEYKAVDGSASIALQLAVIGCFPNNGRMLLMPVGANGFTLESSVSIDSSVVTGNFLKPVTNEKISVFQP